MKKQETAFTKPSRATNEVRDEQLSTETLSFRCNCERWRLMRGAAAFTLAEVLITMAVIGVVAAVALPALLINIQTKVQNEQARTAKYKLTKATDKMKSLGLLDTRYNADNSTELFVNELKKHLKIMKTCDGTTIPLRECWPTSTIELPDNTGADTSFNSSPNVSSLTTGASIKALALGTKETRTMGIVTADGTPMILVYSPKCDPLDSARTYSWSTIDNKPETNATTNCISAIMDINGKKGPNKLGKDVRTLNSLYGALDFAAGYAGISKSECNSLKSRLGINKCPIDGDRWAAAVKKCHDLGLHLPSEQTLATATGARYGRSDITKDTIIGSKAWVDTKDWPGSTCEEKIKDFYGVTDAICITKGKNGETVEAGNMYQDDNNAPIMLEGHYWLNIEVDSAARVRYIGAGLSNYFISDRDNGIRRALCVGD